MSIIPAHYRAGLRRRPDLRDIATRQEPVCASKAAYDRILERHVTELSALQQLHYASGRCALLIIFQGIDAAGKDGAIRHVMSGVDPQGCEVFCFKEPSAEELRHDFLWRATCRLPERGRIGIFNRSYYENVLVVKVHPELLEGQLPLGPQPSSKAIWAGRYRSIVEMEEHLARCGTHIVKIFLHLSKGEQKRRFLERLTEPDKNWKFSAADVHERKYWSHYVKAFEQCIENTGTTAAPWYIVPADDKESARLIVSQIILDRMRRMTMGYPAQSGKRRRELKAMRKML